MARPTGERVLDPLSIPKYETPLVIPPAMPRTGVRRGKGGVPIDYYEIAVRQFRQPVLPASMKLEPTQVWSYGSVNHPGSHNYPAFSIEAGWGRPVRVKWINDLVKPNGEFRPHLLPVDQTLHWANPPGGARGRDAHGFEQSPYRGPVPIVTHLHGGHSTEESDGYPEAWYLPRARDIPAGYARTGSMYRRFQAKAQHELGQAWTPGSAVFQYENDQRAATMWYHDHTLGVNGPTSTRDRRASTCCGAAPPMRRPRRCPVPRRLGTTHPDSTTSRFQSRFRTARSPRAARCSTQTAAPSSRDSNRRS